MHYTTKWVIIKYMYQRLANSRFDTHNIKNSYILHCIQCAMYNKASKTSFNLIAVYFLQIRRQHTTHELFH